MKTTSLMTILLVLDLAAVAVSAQYHDPIYLFGGYFTEWPTSGSHEGVNKADNTGAAPVVTQLVKPGYTCRSIKMDADNHHVLFGVEGTTSASPGIGSMRSGIFRYDPTTMLVATVFRATPNTVTYLSVFDIILDQDGDALAG